MKIEKTSSNVYELENRAYAEKMIFTIERHKDGKVYYFVNYMGVEMMMDETEFYDLKEMILQAYKLGLEEEKENGK